VELERLHVSWNGSFELDGFSIGPRDDEPKQPLLAVGKVRARWGWGPLFSLKLRLDECTVDGLHVTVARSPSGEWNLLTLIPPGAETPAPSEEEKPPGEPFRLEEFPIQALHVALHDWRVDFIDNASTQPLRAGFRLDSLNLDLPSPSEPMTMGAESGLYLGDEATSIPITAALVATPASRGYLDWQNLRTRFDLTMPGQSAHLLVNPRSYREETPTAIDLSSSPEPGIVAEVLWDLTPSVFVEFARDGLPFEIPASVGGTISGRLRASWDSATSAGLTLGTTWHDFSVTADPLGPEPLRLGDMGVFLDLGANEDNPDAPPFSIWDLRTLGFHSDFVQVSSIGKISGLAPSGAPHAWLTWDIRHAPASLEPLLTQLGIPFPDQARMIRNVAYSGLVRGGPSEPIDVTGIFETTLASPSDPGAIVRLGALHTIGFDFEKDSVDFGVTAGEFLPVLPKSGSFWKSEPWFHFAANAAPVIAPDRAAAWRLSLQPGPPLDIVTRLGFLPEGFPTTGTVTSSGRFEQHADGSMRAALTGDAKVGVTPSFPFDSPLPQPLHGLRPLGFSLAGANLGFVRSANASMRVETTGTVSLVAGWDAPATFPLALKTGVRLPTEWAVAVDLPTAAPIDVAAELRSDPALHLSGAYRLDQSQPIRVATRVRFDPGTQTLEHADTTGSFGDWVRFTSTARADRLGRDRIDSSTQLDVDWGHGLLSWIPPEIVEPLGGLVTSGTTQVALTATGRWDPERPGDSVESDLRITQDFRTLRVGPEDRPLVNARDWELRLGLDAAASPARPIQPLRLTAGAALAHTDSLALAVLQDITADARLEVDPSDPMPIEWDARAAIDRIASIAGPLPVRLGPLRCGTTGRFHAKTFDVNLDSAWVELADLASARADARFTSATRELAFHAQADTHSLGKWVRLPLDMLQAAEDQPIPELPWSSGQPTFDVIRLVELVPPLDGAAGGSFSVEGTLPTPDDLHALRLPLTVDLSAHLDDFATTLPAPASTALHGLNQSFTLTAGGSRIQAAAPGSLDAVEYAGLFPLRMDNLTWGGTLETDLAEGIARWRDASFSVPSLGLSAGTQGTIDGWAEPLRYLLKPESIQSMKLSDWVSIAQNLIVRSESSLVWQSADWMTFAPSEARGRGRLELYTRARQEPGREVESVAGMALDDFALRFDPLDVRLTGASGSLDMLLSGRRDLPPPPPEPYLTDRLFDQTVGVPLRLPGTTDGLARILSPARPDQLSTCRIREIAFQNWAVRGITLRSEGDIRRWTVYAEIEDLLSGKVRGRMSLRQANDGGWDLDIDAELTGVSGRTVIPTWRNLPARETEVSGVGSFRWHLAPDADDPEELLRGIDIRFVVTHVGSRALQGFLLALDPEEKNPSFVAGRQALNLGRPDNFIFTFKHGLMDMEVGLTTFAGLGFTIPLLKRAPVGEITRLETLQARLRAVLLVRRALDALNLLDRWATPGSTEELLAEIRKP